MVKECNLVQQDSSIVDQEDIDAYIHQESDREETATDDDEDNTMTISNHLKTPNNDLLFLVNNRWDNYAATLQKCGYNAVKVYMSDKNLVNIYGKSASAQHEKMIREKQDTI